MQIEGKDFGVDGLVKDLLVDLVPTASGVRSDLIHDISLVDLVHFLC